MVNRLLVNSRLLEFREHARRLGDGGNQLSVEGEADSMLSLAVSPVGSKLEAMGTRWLLTYTTELVFKHGTPC